MRSLSLVVFLCHLCRTVIVFGQTINPGPRFTAMGNSGAALSGIWSLQSNQAGLGAVRRPTVAAGCESVFLQSGIRTQSLLAAVPFHNNVFGLSIQNYGITGYRVQRLGVALQKSFGESVSAALGFNIHQLSIDKYGSATAWTAEAGLQYRPFKGLTVGSHISNPGRGSFAGNMNSPLPLIFAFGASWQSGTQLILNSAFVLQEGDGGDFRAGMEYKPAGAFSFSGGLSCNPFGQYAGFCCNCSKLAIETAVSYHPALGYSPQLSVAYEF